MTAFLATPHCDETLPPEIARQARGKGGLLGRLCIRGTLLRCDLEYLKSIVVQVEENPGGQRWAVIVDAVTGQSGLLEFMPELAPCEGVAFSGAPAYYSAMEACSRAERFVRHLSARLFMRPRPVQATGTTEFYRPHWVAYYGTDSAHSTHFLHFPADGLSFHR